MKFLKKIVCRRVSLILVFCLLNLNLTGTVIYAEEMSNADIAHQIVVELMDMNASLNDIGLSLDDFKDIPQQSPEFYRDLRAYVSNTKVTTSSTIIKGVATTLPAIDFNEIINNNDVEDTNSERRDNAEQTATAIAYAHKMAVINMARDSNAKDIDSETLYMFMSHFVDIKPQPDFTVREDYSDDIYFSAWIVDRDRKTYDSYLSYVDKSEKIRKTLSNAIAIYNVVSSITDMKNLIDGTKEVNSKIKAFFVSLGADGSLVYNPYVSCRDIFLPAIKGAKDYLQNNNKPKVEKMVELIKTNLDSENYGQWERDTAICLFFSIMTFLGDHDIFSLMKNIAISTLSLQILLAKDFVDNLRWKSMIWTLNERVAERSWRSFGF